MQDRWGTARAAALVENALARIAEIAVDRLRVRRILVAGGETSGAVAAALRLDRLVVRRVAAPGVPWMSAYGRRRTRAGRLLQIGELRRRVVLPRRMGGAVVSSRSMTSWQRAACCAEAGLSPGSSGNVSIRVEDRVYATPIGRVSPAGPCRRAIGRRDGRRPDLGRAADQGARDASRGLCRPSRRRAPWSTCTRGPRPPCRAWSPCRAGSPPALHAVSHPLARRRGTGSLRTARLCRAHRGSGGRRRLGSTCCCSPTTEVWSARPISARAVDLCEELEAAAELTLALRACLRGCIDRDVPGADQRDSTAPSPRASEQHSRFVHFYAPIGVAVNTCRTDRDRIVDACGNDATSRSRVVGAAHDQRSPPPGKGRR